MTAAAVAAALFGMPAAAAPTAEPACPVDRPDEATALATARACGGEVRIAGLTNEYDEGWAQPNGEVRWEHHFRPVRVKRDMAWVPVDTTSLAKGKLSSTPVQTVQTVPTPGVRAARSDWTMIDSGNPATSYWNSGQDARVGTNNGGANTYRSFYNLSLAATPLAGKHISESTFWVKETGSASCTPRKVDLWSTTRVTSATTWNNPPEYLSRQSSQTVAKGFSSSCPAGQVGFDALQVTRAAASGNWSDVTLGLRSPDETDSSYYKAFDNNPYLSITYDAYATVTSMSTVPEMPCVTGASRPYIRTARLDFRVRVTDPEGASVTALFEWAAVGGPFMGSEQLAPGASGSLFTGNLPWATFADGGSYSWRARGYDSRNWGPWSSRCEFTVDTTAPSAAPAVTSTTYPSGQWAGGAFTAGTFTFDPAGVSDAAAYEYGLDTNPPTRTVAASAIGGPGTVSITPGTDGRHSLYVRTRDRAGNVSATTRYDFKAGTGSVEDAEAAAAAIVVRNIDDVRGNLTLPASGAHDTTITWSSSDSSVIDGTGVVHRHPSGKGTATVTLTATVTSGEASATRDFTATVRELPVAQPKTGYLFSYFKGEGATDDEQIYSALSKANDPLSYQEVKNAKPVLTSTLGTKGLRDPFIIRSPEGDKFYQIATDLRIDGNGDEDASQRTGSKSIMVWESTDLVNWTDQRLVKVSPDTAGNTSAPEAYYDETLGAYVVFWASKLYDAADTGHTGSTYNRLMYATTRDFYTFSEPKVWKDLGYSATDSTMIEHNGTYYRFTKDERNTSPDSPCNKLILEEKSTSIRNTGYDFVGDCIGYDSVSAGAGPLVFKSNTEDRWYLFVEEHGGHGYVPFTTTDLDSGKWTKVASPYSLPRNSRHGTVLPITQAEYDRLLTAYQPSPLVTGADPSR